MSVTVLQAAENYRLTTMDAVMAEITMGDQILFAESLIDQASAAIARECGTMFAQQAYREVQVGGFPPPLLLLRYGPLVTVGPVSQGATVITDYRIESAAPAMLSRRAGWPRGWSDADDWTVDYIAGYILPGQLTPPDPTGPTLRTAAPDLERACIESIKVWFHERLVDSRIESRTLGDQRIDYGVQARHTGLPVLAKDLLKPWRRVRVA